MTIIVLQSSIYPYDVALCFSMYYYWLQASNQHKNGGGQAQYDF